jgi:hypothetical protein
MDKLPKILDLILPLLLLGAIAGCDSNPPIPVNITNPMAYLVQSKNPDGNTSTPLTSSDVMNYRRTDIGGYQIEDSFLTPSGSAITTWSYSPFGPYVQANGDGGEEYVFEKDTVRISSTQHGGYPTGYFVGKDCGGSGWVVFRVDASSEWKSMVAKLSISFRPNACEAKSQSYTRYKTASIDYPSIGPVESIVSEHYDHGTMEASTAMERFFLGKGWGRLVWQGWASNRDPSPDIATRCPDFGWNTPPAPQLKLVDCRVVTTIVPPAGTITGAQEWHP